jgi:hypothetical protein
MIVIAKDATVLGSIPAFSDKVNSEGKQMKFIKLKLN